MCPARALILAVAAAAAAPLLVVAPVAADAVSYRPPVPGPVIDPYRPPDNPYGSGNRGIDYATTPGEPVAAPASGEVTFAGAVGGSLHVVLLHADGIRTSLSFLVAILVRRGQRVAGGDPVARAGSSVHFGARRGEAYIDPASLFGRTPGGRAVLVPEDPGRPLGVAEEAAGIHRLLAGDRPVVPQAVPPPARRSAPGDPPDRPAAGLRAVAVVSPPAAALVFGIAIQRARRRPRARAAAATTA